MDEPALPYSTHILFNDHRCWYCQGAVVIEPKFIHQAGTVGHIEDVVVEETLRGHGLGRMLVDRLVSLAKERGCYKCILDCQEKNVAFYGEPSHLRQQIIINTRHIISMSHSR